MISMKDAAVALILKWDETESFAVTQAWLNPPLIGQMYLFTSEEIAQFSFYFSISLLK